MKWDEMTARERDVLVAEKVMDLKPSKGKGFVFNPPRYTTDISAAWEVVEKMDENGWRFDLSTHEARTNYVGVDFETHDGEHFEEASATKPPEAICLAALRAVGVDV